MDREVKLDEKMNGKENEKNGRKIWKRWIGDHTKYIQNKLDERMNG